MEASATLLWVWSASEIFSAQPQLKWKRFGDYGYEMSQEFRSAMDINVFSQRTLISIKL